MKLLAAAILLTGCASQPFAPTAPAAEPVTPIAPVAPAKVAPKTDFCSNAQPIRISKGDRLTPATADAIVAHDRTGQRLCGWKP